MKTTLIFTFIFLTFYSTAQKPEKVYSIVMERREMSWYEQQEELWKKEIDKNEKNSQAWYYYYEAIHAQEMLHPWDSTDLRNEYSDRQDDIVNKLYKTNPNSFEANFLMYRNFGVLGTSGDYFKYLEKAYKIDPLDPRPYDLFFIHYHINRDKAKFKEFCQKFYTANELAPFLYNWSYNLLSGLDQNAILFTGGDNDTYACWVIQQAKNIRPDVHVINTSILNLDDFRMEISKELGLDDYDVRLDSSKNWEAYCGAKKEIFERFFQNDKGYPVYVSATCVDQFEEDFGDSLYLTGLAYKYSSETFDNISIIRRNYEKRYSLDYIQNDFGFHIQNGKKDQLNGTYLPAFVKLYKHYKMCEETGKMKELGDLTKEIAEKSNQLEEIEELMSK